MITDRAIIAITGRNESPHIAGNLESWLADGVSLIFFDSGSTDDTVQRVRERRVEVVDVPPPYSTPHARRFAVETICQRFPGAQYILIMDGDCSLTAEWVHWAIEFLDTHSDVAAVNGRRIEADRDASPYHRLLHMEWDYPRGYVDTIMCDALYRLTAINEVGGFDDRMVSGDEPELGHRLHLRGWKIYASPELMSTHHGHLKSIHQLWQRNLRTGYGYALLEALYRNTTRPKLRREVISNWVWGLVLPAASILLAPFTYGVSLVLGLVAYLALMLRMALAMIRRDYSLADALLYAAAVMWGKLPMALGQLRYRLRPTLSVVDTAMDYKR